MPSIIWKSILPVLLIALHAHGQFNPTHMRPMSFDENVDRFSATLAQLVSLRMVTPVRFPKDFKFAEETQECVRISSKSASILGAIDPAQIKPLYTRPSALFFSHFERCATLIAEAGFSTKDLAQKNAQEILGPKLYKSMVDPRLEINPQWTQKLNSIPPNLQMELAEAIILSSVGPEQILLEKKYIGEGNVFNNPSLTGSYQLMNFLMGELTGRYPDDTMLQFYSRLFSLLRLGPALKN